MRIDRFFFSLIFFIASISIVSAQSETETLKQKLIDGNQRFVNSQMLHPNISEARRTEVSKGQKPFAVIVACSDSRVAPEIVFDQGLGDLFVIRTAGQVVDDIALASIEYAVEHLGTQLVVVVGHQKCGAVDAAVKGAKLHAHLNRLIAEITPSVETAKKEKGDLLDNSIKQNVKSITNKLKNSEPVLHEFVKEKKVAVIGAYYSLQKGVVEFID